MLTVEITSIKTRSEETLGDPGITVVLVEIGPKACTLLTHGQSWQGHASCLKKTQLVGSLEVPTSLHQCSGFPVVG